MSDGAPAVVSVHDGQLLLDGVQRDCRSRRQCVLETVWNRRTTTEDVEIGGREIPAGANVALMWIAANRDPARFDEPDDIRLDRDTSESLVWGRGIHVCLGAPLARLRLRLALEEILSRTSSIEASGPAWRSVYPSDGMAELRLRLHPAT